MNIIAVIGHSSRWAAEQAAAARSALHAVSKEAGRLRGNRLGATGAALAVHRCHCSGGFYTLSRSGNGIPDWRYHAPGLSALIIVS